MRLFPILAAVTVICLLYLVIFQREALLEGLGTSPAEQNEAVERPAANSDVGNDAGVSVVAIHSQARQIEGAVLVRGRTEASRRVVIRSETSGQVTSNRLNKGGLVKTGDILCHLDQGTREAGLAEASARLAEARAREPEAEARVIEAKARLDEALINLNAAEKLSEGGFASDSRVANARASVEAARAGVIAAQSGASTSSAAIQSAESAVATAQRELERIEITAPLDGILESDSAELGSLLQPGAECATLIQLNPIRLVGFVPELMVDFVAVGATVQARLANGEEITGLVTYIADSSDPNTRTFRVEVEADNSDRGLREGRTVEIAIASAGRQAHLLPQSALTLDDEGRLGVRIVTENGRAGFAPVEMVRDSREGVWVTGLADEAKVIVIGHHYVTDDVLVDVTMQEPDA
ncbi:efflux RND transporter periplasmic adaptor subunit [Aliiroseovarius sp. KMU-50]|uniref:Efflux RND transporter periplasmic adaptor subunit n=1 Tax=Aliiroseovarius salicola TaxID=3009082 RepID=A0ABT4W1I3_9RHOB|nr:efflux RND transporter periplasmic adaptor subunit [Aliiroseovarius sp. KMU-50]MDA5094362.1 efflux RND transporter periplasmic adaptor subunit [Aliiroseovarius sp. KMU-50]